MFDFLISIMMLYSPEVNLTLGVQLSRNNSYERSEHILQTIKSRDLRKPEVYHFYRMINNFKMNNKKEAEKYAYYLENAESILPERYKVVASLIREDMSQWKDKNQLDDIARDMGHVTDRIKTAEEMKKTRKIQDDIVARLDKMIKEQEDKKKKDKEDQEKNQGDQESSAQRPVNPDAPMEDSRPGTETGTGNVDMKKFKNLTEKWGSLPPREQQRALQELTQGMSARHRESIENYFRNLAAATNKK